MRKVFRLKALRRYFRVSGSGRLGQRATFFFVNPSDTWQIKAQDLLSEIFTNEH